MPSGPGQSSSPSRSCSTSPEPDPARSSCPAGLPVRCGWTRAPSLPGLAVGRWIPPGYPRSPPIPLISSTTASRTKTKDMIVALWRASAAIAASSGLAGRAPNTGHMSVGSAKSRLPTTTNTIAAATEPSHRRHRRRRGDPCRCSSDLPGLRAGPPLTHGENRQHRSEADPKPSHPCAVGAGVKQPEHQILGSQGDRRQTSKTDHRAGRETQLPPLAVACSPTPERPRPR